MTDRTKFRIALAVLTVTTLVLLTVIQATPSQTAIFVTAGEPTRLILWVATVLVITGAILGMLGAIVGFAALVAFLVCGAFGKDKTHGS